MTKILGRDPKKLRTVKIQRGAAKYAEGSALIAMGQTRVLCAASVEKGVPRWMAKDDPRGWITAEYGMLPRSTSTRTRRERSGTSGRTHEIQRLIGRSLRAVADLSALAGFTVTVDCDVLQADGGTRTAAITGGYVAVYDACKKLLKAGTIARFPLVEQVAAVSVGVWQGELWLDLDYERDKDAEVDLNVVMTGSGRFCEVQGTAEGAPFSRERLDELLDLAAGGVRQLLAVQKKTLRIK